jgi:hypothetical protein
VILRFGVLPLRRLIDVVTGFAVVQMGYKLLDAKKCVFHRKEGRWRQDGLLINVGCWHRGFVAGSTLKMRRERK